MARQGKGAVINLTSVHAFAGMTEHTVYAATKSAIVSFTRVAALELIQKGIRMNAIAPGWIFVENHRTTLGEDFDVEAAGKTIPAGFIGAPQDVADLTIYLASDGRGTLSARPSSATGANIGVAPHWRFS